MKIPHVSHRPWKPSLEALWRPPQPRPWFVGLVRLIGPAYVRWGLGLDGVVLKGESVLSDVVGGTSSPNDRAVVVFRHCGDADPQGLWFALNVLLGRKLRPPGSKRRLRFLFLASAEIALWGGWLARFALRASGTLPLAHGRGSRPSLDYLRRHFKTSTDPVVLAPEGQITYELNGPIHLDPGAAHLALWAADAVKATGGKARVVPVGVRYRVPRETWRRWHRFLATLEIGVGLPVWDGADIEGDAGRRLTRLWDHLLDEGEDYYRRNHHGEFPPLIDRGDRVRRLTRTAVGMAAALRGLGPEEVRSTVFQLRAAALDVVFPRHGRGSRLGRLLDERAAAEAWWIHRHQELGDLLQCLHPEDLPEHPDLETAVEAALNLADLAGRLSGGHIDHRPRFFRRVLEISFGEAWTIAPSGTGSHQARVSEISGRIRAAFESLRLR